MRRSPFFFGSIAVSVSLASLAAGCGLDVVGTQPVTQASPNEPAPGEDAGPALPGPSTDPDAAVPTVPGDDAAPPTSCLDPVLSFDGVDDDATVAHDARLDLDESFTIEAWINPGPKALTEDMMTIASHGDAAASRGWTFRVRGGRVELVLYGGDLLSSYALVAGGSDPGYLTPGAWVHVAATYDTNTMRIYVAGVRRASRDVPFGFDRDRFKGPLHIGRDGALQANHFQGEIDGLRLSDAVRYNGANAAKPAAPFAVDNATVALFPFDEAAGLDIKDAVPNGLFGTLAAGTKTPKRLVAPCVKNR